MEQRQSYYPMEKQEKVKQQHKDYRAGQSGAIWDRGKRRHFEWKENRSPRPGIHHTLQPQWMIQIGGKLSVGTKMEAASWEHMGRAPHGCPTHSLNLNQDHCAEHGVLRLNNNYAESSAASSWSPLSGMQLITFPHPHTTTTTCWPNSPSSWGKKKKQQQQHIMFPQWAIPLVWVIYRIRFSIKSRL